MSVNHSDMNPTPSPCVMVIFGATGDLTKRKLIPALCNLAQDDVLPKQSAIVGFARRCTWGFLRPASFESWRCQSHFRQSARWRTVWAAHLLARDCRARG